MCKIHTGFGMGKNECKYINNFILVTCRNDNAIYWLKDILLKLMSSCKLLMSLLENLKLYILLVRGFQNIFIGQCC